MAFGEGPVWDPYVYVFEDILAASDIQVFTIMISVTLYFQYIAQIGRAIRRERRVNREIA